VLEWSIAVTMKQSDDNFCGGRVIIKDGSCKSQVGGSLGKEPRLQMLYSKVPRGSKVQVVPDIVFLASEERYKVVIG